MSELMSMSHTLVPIFAILAGIVAILMPVAIVAVALHYRNRRNEALYETVRHLADMGQPVPPELLDPPASAAKRSETPLFRAVTLIGVGVGLSAMFALLGLQFLVGIGALLVCIGIAQLIALRIEARRAAPPA
jgi:hypothetical protein